MLKLLQWNYLNTSAAPSIMKPPSLCAYLAKPAIRRGQLQCLRRTYAVQAPGAPTIDVFNRKVKHMQKDRAARNVEQSRNVDYLRDEVASRLCERLLVSQRVFNVRVSN